MDRMDNLVAHINASGGHAESHSRKTFDHAVLALCAACGTRYFIGNAVFVQTAGRCSCSWSCCDVARPGNKPHARHMDYRAATAAEIKEFEYTGKDLR